MSVKTMMSSDNPNAELDMMNMNQHEVCMSWWWSNSFLRISSALFARMVDKPFNVATKWVKTGDLAVDWWKHFTNYRELHYLFKTFKLLPLASKCLMLFDVFRYALRMKTNTIPNNRIGTMKIGLTYAVTAMTPTIWKITWVASSMALGRIASITLQTNYFSNGVFVVFLMD